MWNDNSSSRRSVETRPRRGLLLRAALFWLTLICAAAPARAAITVVGSTSSSNGNVARTSLQLAVPAGVQFADLLVAQVVMDSTGTLTAPAGWTLISSSPTTNYRHNLYYRVVTDGEAASHTWTFGGSSRIASGGMIALRGTDLISPLVDANDSVRALSSNNVVSPSVTASTAGSIRLSFYSAENGGGNLTSINDPTISYRVTNTAVSNNISAALAYSMLATAGPTPSYGATAPSGVENHGQTLVFRPAAPACFDDTFNRTGGVGSDWTVATIAGGFTPTIVNNRLRLTDARNNASTAAALQRIFPAAGNRIEMVFNYYGYGGSANPADGIAITVSDAAVTPQPGGFGGSLGYAPNGAAAGFAGGWLGIGIDEYGNYQNPTEGRVGGSGFIPDSVAIRGSAPNYRWIAGTGTLSPALHGATGSGAAPGRGDQYRVIVDSRIPGQSWVSVERNTGFGFTTLIARRNVMTATGQTAMPNKVRFSLTGSTGGETNIHEIDNLNICALSVDPVEPQIDHIRFTHTAQASTCGSASVAVQACMDAACATTYPGPVSVSLVPSGWVGGDTQTIQGSGSTLELQRTAAETVTLGVTGTNPALRAFSTPKCFIGGTASDCRIAFVNDPELSFNVVDVPTEPQGLIAGKTSSAIAVKAVRRDDKTQACVPAFANVSRDINFWSTYVAPASGTRQVTVNNVVVPTASPGVAIPLTFNANGESTIDVLYGDAGQLRLDASATSGGATVSGFDIFEVRPAGLCVDSTDANWQCSNADRSTCSAYRKVDTPFALRVRGVVWDAGGSDACGRTVTPNYLHAGIPLSSSLVAPLVPGAAGSLSVTSVDVAQGNNGGTVANQTMSEVGVFTIRATPNAGSYYSMTVPPGQNDFGRFIPYGFNIKNASVVHHNDAACTDTFTYIGEPLGLRFDLEAVDSENNALANYHGSFAKLNPSAAGALLFGARSGTTVLSGRIASSCPLSGGSPNCGSFVQGVAAVRSELTLQRANAPEGPYNTAANRVAYGLRTIDSDNVALLAPDFDRDGDSVNESKAVASADLLYGRLRLQNASGSEQQNLPVTARVEFWNGTLFRPNTADNCTRLRVPAPSTLATNTASAQLNALYCSGGVGFHAAAVNNRLDQGETVARLHGVSTAGANVRVVGGDAGLSLTKPGAGNHGYVDMSLWSPGWLRFNWNGVDQNVASCAAAADGDLNDDNPRARLRFGGFRRQNVIYMREMFF